MALIAVLDYGIGNLRSATKALERVGADAHLTADPDLVAAASGVVLPGVGSFGRCMEALHDSGLAGPATDAARSGRPFLGICIGMQMLYEGSDESPAVPGLGVLPGRVGLLPDTVKRPQMQWNTLRAGDGGAGSRLLAGIDAEAWFYFVHSYVAPVSDHTVATCDYGGPQTAVVEHGEVWATQFHPEKSGRAGLGVLANFVRHAAAAARAA
jgi:glutamine amidotransferase